MCFLVLLGYTVIRIGQFIDCHLRYRKQYLKSTFCSDDLLSQRITVLARRLYGRFYERFFVGRELGTRKFNSKMVSHMHSHVIIMKTHLCIIINMVMHMHTQIVLSISCPKFSAHKKPFVKPAIQSSS